METKSVVLNALLWTNVSLSHGLMPWCVPNCSDALIVKFARRMAIRYTMITECVSDGSVLRFFCKG